MDFELVYAADLDRVLRESRGLLIDIREREDYRAGHWQGAVNYPYDEIERGRARLPKNRKLILYCEHGGGSMQLARTLGQRGYAAATVVGGYAALRAMKK